MKKVWVTGNTGFVGTVLSKRLRENGFDVLVSDLDLQDERGLERFIAEANFDSVVHLAGISSVAACESDPGSAMCINTLAVIRLAKMVFKKAPEAHFIFPSTGQVYVPKEKDGDHSFCEENPISPLNTYAWSKYLAEQGLMNIASRGHAVTCLRIFNHSHKSQKPEFFLPSIYAQMVEAKKQGKAEVELIVGNLDLERDIGSVNDLISAFEVLISKGKLSGGWSVYNMSSGATKNLRNLAHILASRLGLSVRFVVNPDLLRKNEPKKIIASCDNFSRDYSWSPVDAVNADALIDSFLRDIH